MICPNCKIIVPDSAEFCQRCHFSLNVSDPIEKTIKAEKLKEMLICPKCGALHTPTAKFCRNDGTPLSKNEDNPENEDINTPKKGKRISLKRILLFSLISISFLALLILYLSERIPKEASEKDLPIKSSENNISITKKDSPEPAYFEVEINRLLRKNGIEGIYVEVDKEFKATITGFFLSNIDRLKTFNIVESFKEIRSIVDNTKKTSRVLPKIGASRLKEKISNSLKREGFNNLHVEVDDSLNVTIKGAVRSKEEKDRVFETAKSFKKDAKSIKDLIFIVEH